MPKRPKSITLKDVAAAAGLSVGMASRVLGEYGSFSARSRKKVLEAAERLNYRANGAARSLRLNRSRTIGVMVSNIVSYHWTVFVLGVEECARGANYRVILCNTADDPQREREYLDAMREYGVDGIIASPLTGNNSVFADLAASGLPLAIVNGSVPGDDVIRITADDRQAAVDAVTYLGSLGHRRIGLVAGLQELQTGRNRFEGYKAGLAQLGLRFEEDLVAYGNYRWDEAYSAARQLITMSAPPTAILVGSEQMTGAALRCFKDHAVSIPDQLSLIGFGDPAWASFYVPAITTLREERFYEGRLACDALFEAIRGKDEESRQRPRITLRIELMRRESCGPPRSSRRLKYRRPAA